MKSVGKHLEDLGEELDETNTQMNRYAQFATRLNIGCYVSTMVN